LALKKEITKQIRDLLRQNPGGLSITAIVRQIPINRNTAGRYLENLMVSGQVEMRHFGMAKIYSLAQRVPLSAMLSISSELIMLLDRSRRVIYANEPMLDFLDVTQRGLYGKAIEYTALLNVFDEEFDALRRKVQEGIAGKEWSGEIAARNGTIIFSCRIAPAVFEEGQRGVSILLENITERKKTEKAIRESEETLRSVADNTPDTILLTDLEGKILFINHSFTIPPEEIPRRSVFEFIPEKYHARAKASIMQVVKTGNVAVYQSDHRFPGGEVRYFESTIGPVFHESKVIALVINSRDITERILSEQDLRESEDRYRSLVEVSPDAIFLHQDGQIIYMNPAARKILEIPSLPASLSSAVIDRIPPDIRETVRENIRSDLNGEMTPPLEIPFQRHDGSWIILDGRGVGTLVGGRAAVQVTLRDITERKKAEDAVRESKRRLVSSQHIARLGDVTWDLKTGKATWSEGMYRLLGFDPAERIDAGRVYLMNHHPDDRERVSAWLDAAISSPGDRIPPNEYRIIRADGEVLTVHAEGEIQRVDGKPARVMVTIQDITERKEAEDAIRKSRFKLGEALDLARMANWEYDVGRNVFTFDDRFYALYGTTAEREGSNEMCPDTYVREFIHPDDRFIMEPTMRAALTATDPDYHAEVEHRIVRRDGAVRHIAVHIRVILDNEGRVARTYGTNQDITVRKEAEIALRKSRQYLEDAMDTADLYTWEYNPGTDMFLFNDRFFTLFGTDAGIEDGYTVPMEGFIRTYVHPDDRDVLFAALRRIRQSPESQFVSRREGKIIRRDGCIRHVLALTRILRNPENGTMSVQGTLQDITDQKQVEEALRKSRQQLEDAMGMADLYTWEYDPAADTFLFNDHLFPLFGTTPDQEGGYAIPSDTFLREFVHPADRSDLIRGVENSLKSADPHYVGRNEARIIRKDGEIRHVVTLIRAQKDPEREAVLVQGTLQDVTRQKRAEAAIRESEATARALINAPTDRIILTDNAGRILDLNEAAAQSLGKKRDEIMGKPPSAVLSPASAAVRMPRMMDVIATGKAARFIDEREGIWFDNVIYPVFNPQGEVARLAIVARDITDQKHAEAALRESESRYRTLAEASQDIIFLIGQDDTVEYVNSYAAAMLGIPAGQIIGRNRSSFFKGELGERQARGLRRVFETGKAGRSEGPMEMSGSLHWFDHFLMPITDANGKVTAVLGVSRDITDRRSTEKALAESEDRYRDLITTTPDIIWEADTERRLVYVSPAVEQILGYRPEELIGRSPFEFFDPEVRARSQGAFDNVVRMNAPLIVFDSRWLHKDGHVVILETRARPIIRGDGSFAGFRGIDRDVTEQRKTEGALAESEKRFRDLAELLPQNVWECSIDGKLTFANRYSFEMYRYAPEDIQKGLYIWQMIHPDDRERVMGDFIEALKHPPEDFPTHHEYTAVRSDGSTFPVIMYHVPVISDNTITGMRGIGIDLTGRRQMEEALMETIRAYRLLAETSVDIITRIRADGTCIYASPAVRGVLGFEPEEVVGLSALEYVHPDDLGHVMEMIAAFSSNGNKTGTDTFRIRHKDGSYIRFEATIRATRDEGGQIAEFTLVCRSVGTD